MYIGSRERCVREVCLDLVTEEHLLQDKDKLTQCSAANKDYHVSSHAQQAHQGSGRRVI